MSDVSDIFTRENWDDFRSTKAKDIVNEIPNEAARWGLGFHRSLDVQPQITEELSKQYPPSFKNPLSRGASKFATNTLVMLPLGKMFMDGASAIPMRDYNINGTLINGSLLLGATASQLTPYLAARGRAENEGYSESDIEKLAALAIAGGLSYNQAKTGKGIIGNLMSSFTNNANNSSPKIANAAEKNDVLPERREHNRE